jgi:DNA repair protein RecO (recombination protein O)
MGFSPTNNCNEERKFFDMASGCFTLNKPIHSNFLDAGESHVFSLFIDCSYEEMGAISLTAAQRNQLIIKMIDYYSLHLGIRLQIKSLDVLREIFS